MIWIIIISIIIIGLIIIALIPQKKINRSGELAIIQLEETKNKKKVYIVTKTVEDQIFFCNTKGGINNATEKTRWVIDANDVELNNRCYTLEEAKEVLEIIKLSPRNRYKGTYPQTYEKNIVYRDTTDSKEYRIRELIDAVDNNNVELELEILKEKKLI